MSKLPLITVCIVVYNGKNSIARALDSIVQQSYPNIEILVIDGASTDGTHEVIRQYANHIATYVCEPDHGAYDAMNKACRLAKGDWLIFLGYDDVFLSTFSTMAKMLKESDTVYYGDVIFRSTGLTYGGRFSRYRLMQSNICHQAIFYPKQIYQRTAYNQKYHAFGDWDYNIRLVGQNTKFQYTGITVAIFDDSGTSSRGDPVFERDRLQIIQKNFGMNWAILKWIRTKVVRRIKCYSPLMMAIDKARAMFR